MAEILTPRSRGFPIDLVISARNVIDPSLHFCETLLKLIALLTLAQRFGGANRSLQLVSRSAAGDRSRDPPGPSGTRQHRRLTQIQPITMKSVCGFTQSLQNDPVVADSVTNHSNSAALRRYATKDFLYSLSLLSNQGFDLCAMCSDQKNKM